MELRDPETEIETINIDTSNIKGFILSCFSKNPLNIFWSCFPEKKEPQKKRKRCIPIILVQWGYFCHPEKYEYEFKNFKTQENPFYGKKQTKYYPSVRTINESVQESTNKVEVSHSITKNKDSYTDLFYYANKKI